MRDLSGRMLFRVPEAVLRIRSKFHFTFRVRATTEKLFDTGFVIYLLEESNLYNYNRIKLTYRYSEI